MEVPRTSSRSAQDTCSRALLIQRPVRGRNRSPSHLGPIYEMGGLAAGGGALWIADASDNHIFRLDPRTGRSTQYALKGSVTSLVFGGGFVWILDDLNGTLTR